MMTATLSTMLALVLAASPTVEVSMLNGQRHRGELSGLDAESLTIRLEHGDIVILPTRDVHLLEPFPAEPPLEAGDQVVQVQLVDGSHLRAGGFQATGGRATILLAGGGEVLAPTAALNAIRFRTQTDELARQWASIEQAQRSADVLVIRKTQGSSDGAQQVMEGLDSLEGVLHDITAERVSFEFDGTKVDVPREKVEGVLYFGRGGSQPPDPVCQLTDRFGSTWNLKSLIEQNGQLNGVSVSGVRVRVPWEHLAKIDYAAGNLVFLSDLEMDYQWRPLIQSAVTPPRLAELFRPRRDQAFFGGPLFLDGQSYEKGLAIHSRTSITYRLPRAFQRLSAIAGIDQRFAARGNVALTITGDGRELWSGTISSDQPPVPLDVDLRGVRRLTLVVDFGDDRSDVGDYLNLCDARLLK